MLSEDVGRDGERIGLVALKKLDCLLEGPFGVVIWDRVSTVLSDNDGLVARPRASVSCAASSSSSSSIPVAVEESPATSVPSLPLSFTPAWGLLRDEGLGRAGFLNILSSDGLRSLVTSRPGSACSLSRDGEGLSDLDAVVVGRGKREASRGIPLGRVGVFGCVSIFAFLWLHASGKRGGRGLLFLTFRT